MAVTLQWPSSQDLPPLKLTLLNVYNRHTSSTTRSVQPELIFQDMSHPVLAIGDFNIHSRISDPRRKHNRREESLSKPYFNYAYAKGYSLLNSPGIFTRISNNTKQRHSVIDLAFANFQARGLFDLWSNYFSQTGSDHAVIKICLQLDSPTNLLTSPKPDWKAANWPSIHNLLKEVQVPPEQEDIEEWFEQALHSITAPIMSSVPQKRISHWSKPWWSPHLTSLRRIYHSVLRDFRKGFAPSFELKAAKNLYFNSIQRAKDTHWNNYIAQADSSQIWALKRSATRDRTPKLPSFPNASTPKETNEALISHFFPPSPNPIPYIPAYDYPDATVITQQEVTQALAASSNNSAPGPDTFPPFAWKQVHLANPLLIPDLLTPLVRKGHHPNKLKSAFGIILPKPNKPDYSSPSAYRIIVLLETVSKILERIMCHRLAEHAKANGLIHPLQCGSIKGLSTADAFTTLQHEIRLRQRAKLKVSTLFLDVKGGFDHVNPTILAELLHKHQTPNYITRWTLSFLAQRKCILLFPGSPRIPLSVDVGVPQGSPISPLLFCIYVSPLHCEEASGITISYVDDFAITVASPSYLQNTHLLEEAYTRSVNIGSPANIHFSLPKTDLMHWRTPKDTSTHSTLTVALGAETIHPSNEIRWLGFQCTPTLDPHTHIKKRVNAANASFAILRKFSTAGKGLTALNCRRLAIMAILPILTYGSTCFDLPRKSIKLLETTWHSVLRWITNCFKSTPTAILHAEASCPPIDLYVLSLRLRYAARILIANPESNPVAARLPTNFPALNPHRNNQNRLLLKGMKNPPVNWNSNRKGVARLPIDQLCNLLYTNSPEFAQNPRTIFNLGLIIKRNMISSWITLPVPPYYKWPIQHKPHLHLALNKFVSGRICQMRAQKNYLAAHPSWMNPDASPICPRCEEEEEDLQHALLYCPARDEARLDFISYATSLEDLFKNKTSLADLSNYIIRTRTGFPSKD